MNLYIRTLASCLAALSLAACVKNTAESSATDPLPVPAELETNKDLSVNPGDSFFDYCNGAWLQSHPIPAQGAIGGAYESQSAMDQRVRQLKAGVPDIGHFFDLMDHMHGQPEKSRAYIDAQRARYTKPATREEAFETMGRMIMDGITPWANPVYATWGLKWVDGKLMGLVIPPIVAPQSQPASIEPENLVPASQTKADEHSAMGLMAKGMGLELSQLVTDPQHAVYWTLLENRSLEDLNQIIEDAWNTYEMFVSQEQMEKVDRTMDYATLMARASLCYTLSYHLAKEFISPAFKEKYLSITREIQASLRNRISQVDWMSETTRNNAIDKLDNCSLFVAYPDEWYPDFIGTYADCETLVEAVHRNNRNIAQLKCRLLGGKDRFTNQLLQIFKDSNGQYAPTDLTLSNAMYSPTFNCVFIYPSLMMPPIIPEGVSDAFSYAAFVTIGHEFTHGFDTQGAQYDKDGNKRNWWTVADQMAFEERRDKIVQCYSHMEMDPVRAPGVYGDGKRTQTENIADLGGFLAVLDAYKARLQKEGFTGETLNDQLRKFYECYALVWCVQYGPDKFDILQKSDIHSHARLRVNGVVMNTDLWYELYNVDRNNYLYLPKDRRTYIW